MDRSVPFIVLSLVIIACAREPDAGPRGTREVYFECASPDRQRIASFYREYGGGAAGWQYEHVEVRSPDDAAPSVVLTLKQGYDVTLEWLSSDSLRIGYPSTARVDHWQDWFGQSGQGNTELVELPGENGRLLDKAPGCVGPPAASRPV